MNESLGRNSGPPSSDVGGAEPPAAAPRVPIAGIGASAGGMEAFIALLRFLPPDTGLALVLIQHLDPTHPSSLAEALARSTDLPVLEIRDGTRVEPNHVYVIPSNADLEIVNGTLTLVARSAQEHKPHLPTDAFFKSLAADLGSQAIGVVLSGTGSDGADGLRAIKAAGGVTFAQAPTTAKYSGMPESAVGTGAVDFSLPIRELARELGRIGQHPFLRGSETDLATSADDTALKKVLLLVRGAVGVDFGEYKVASIKRRCARRMAVRRVTTLDDYVRLLRDDRAEAQALFEDILVHVTSFFRDGRAFEKLKEHVFSEVLQQKRRAGGTIRVWSAGCSTGEEAYSLLISLLEYLAEQDASDVRVQLFGTDISEKAIERARTGFYPDAAFRDVGAQRLARFFTKVEGGGYKINTSVREQCAFVKHDLAKDPPFSKLDLVCCRNVLIYFGQELQRRVLATFHFALNVPGFLVLGQAENVPDGMNLFQSVDKEDKIFARTAVRSTLRLVAARDAAPALPPTPHPRPRSASDIVRHTENLLLSKYAPAGVIVNGRMEILHFRGGTGPYLEPAAGPPQQDLLSMARKGLAADIRIGISQARRDKATVRRAGVRVDHDGSPRVCDVVVIPVSSLPDAADEVFAVLFEEHAPAPDAAGPGDGSRVSPGQGPTPAPGDNRQQLDKLEEELKATKDDLELTIDEHQRVKEELLSANEDLVSGNEELLSLNEELQTGKEELQSTNEELATLNEEMGQRNTELNLVNGDLVNILASVEVPIVIVDGARRIRRFTPKARPILNLLPSDVGRPIDDIKPNLAVEELDGKIREVLETATTHEEEVQSRDGRWFRLQIRPYTTLDRRIDGAVLSVVDIDALKRALGAAEWARDHAKATVEAVQVPLVLLNDKFEVVSANRAFKESYRASPRAGTGRSVHDLMTRFLEVREIRSSLKRVCASNESFQRLEVECDLPELGRRSLAVSGRSVQMLDQGLLILLALEDITDRRRGEVERATLLREAEVAKASAERANRAKDLFLAVVSHELRTPLTSLLLSSQLLQAPGVDEATRRKAAEAVGRAARGQAQLIDDLLDVSRIVAGKLKIEREVLNLWSVVQSAVEVLAPAAEKKRIELRVNLGGPAPFVSGDPGRLRQVVSNLVTNAIKFTPERGRVTVTVDSADEVARIVVTDSGEGIDSEFLPHVFDQFSQEEGGQTRPHGGLGLGLAIVRHLVEEHGGTVQASSAGRGKGSTFTITFPLTVGVEPRASVTESQRSAEEPRRSIRGVGVLVVEDDAATRDALAEMLTLRGAEVRAAPSVASALALFDELTPQMLVCDIAMPNEDGLSLLRRIRARGSSSGGDVPALALTALVSDEDRHRVAEAGFQAHVAKPFDIDQLVAAMVALARQNPVFSAARDRPPA